MEVIYLTMFITVIIAALFLFLFFVNVKKGQYEDMVSPAVRMLFDDDIVEEKPSTTTKNDAATKSEKDS